MAMAERWLAARFNRPGHTVIDHRTWVVCSDGDLMEGVSHEAAELAGHQKLAKLTWIFDDNRITIEGSTDLATSTDQGRRFQGYGWHVQHVDDGNDLNAIGAALDAAAAEDSRPSLIVLRTTIAWGSPNKAGHHDTHGAALGVEEVAATKKNLAYPSLEPFHIPPASLSVWRAARERGERLQSDWAKRFEKYQEAHPGDAAELMRMMRGKLPAGWADGLASAVGSKADATRSSSGKVIQVLAARIPELVGGSADLGSSNKTDIEGAPAMLAGSPQGRVLHFGVREHAMGSVMNGIALHGGLRPFGGTFLIFSDYMRPAIRLAALSHLRVIYVFTHDSIGLGEDGPTHQPVEQLMALRAVPNLMDLRPADPAETAVAWKVAVARDDGPAFLALTRQKIPALDRSRLAGADKLEHGGYVLSEAEGGSPDVILIASGSEVQIALQAQSLLQGRGAATRVVSLPSWHLFAQQSADYRNDVLPPDVLARVSIEAGATLGWGRWVGNQGASIGLDHFGASAPDSVLFEKYGFTAEAVASTAESLLEAQKGSRAHA
jgi:transketolase